MSAIDYGAVIFKNGQRYKAEELFPVIDELDVVFYKYYMDYPIPTTAEGYSRDAYIFGSDNKKSYRFTHNNCNYYIKEIANNVYRCQVNDLSGNRFFIIFGYGIDNDKEIWDRVKYIYHNKKDVHKIDNILRRFDW